METNLDKNAPLTERATLGGGCFWCLEAVYQQISGVKSVVSGYMPEAQDRILLMRQSAQAQQGMQKLSISFLIQKPSLFEIYWKSFSSFTILRL